jgi:hypothetical protein
VSSGAGRPYGVPARVLAWLRAARPRTWLFYGLCVLALVPLWLVKRPPMQDFPQHLAAIRVLLDHDDPSYGLSNAVEIDLARTQYLAVYFVGCLLTRMVGTLVAGKLLFSAAIVGIPLATRRLLSELGRDERVALACFPFLYNAHVLLGFLNFVAALPLALYALVLAVRFRRGGSWQVGALLALMLALVFYTHVLPFAMAALGVALVAIQRDKQATVRGLLPLVPAGFASVLWSQSSPAGSSTADAMVAAFTGQKLATTTFNGPELTLHELPSWLTDNLPGSYDQALLWVSLGVLVGAVVWARAERHGPLVEGNSAGRRLWVLPLVAVVGAFVMPVSHDWIWPISGRFPYLALIFAVPVLPAWERTRGKVLLVSFSLLAVLHIGQYAYAFRKFETEEATGFEEVLNTIPRGATVAGLVYDGSSLYVGRHPFMHFPAYSQAKNGGVYSYSFAETRQSPFSYRRPGGPPKVDFNRGWNPSYAPASVLAEYFDYCVMRRAHPHSILVARYYDLYAHVGDWSVWRRKEELRTGKEKPEYFDNFIEAN